MIDPKYPKEVVEQALNEILDDVYDTADEYLEDVVDEVLYSEDYIEE